MTSPDPPFRHASRRRSFRDGGLAYAVAVLLLVGIGAGFLDTGGGGHVAELLVVGVAVLGAYAVRWPLATVPAIAAAAAILPGEAHEGRLDVYHVWRGAAFAAAAAGAALASRLLRLR